MSNEHDAIKQFIIMKICLKMLEKLDGKAKHMDLKMDLLIEIEGLNTAFNLDLNPHL